MLSRFLDDRLPLLCLSHDELAVFRFIIKDLSFIAMMRLMEKGRCRANKSGARGSSESWEVVSVSEKVKC